MNKNKLSFDFIRNFIKENNCLLISKEYKNVDTPLKIQCSCGCVFNSTFSNFKKKKFKCCSNCRKKDLNKNLMLDKLYVENFIKKYDCILISEYKNYNSKIKIRCKCGKTFISTFAKFRLKKYKCCPSCKKEEIYKSYSLSQSEVELYFKKYNCKLLSKYKNSRDKLKIKCSCGNIFEKSLNKFKNHKHKTCPDCYPINNWNFDTVKEFIEKDSNSNCVLLNNVYINRDKPLNLLCGCGEEFSVNFFNFLYGKQRICKKCSSEQFSLKTTLSYEQVKSFVDNKGGELISKTYKDRKSPLLIRCSCGDVFERTYNSLKGNSCSCMKCSKKISSMEKIAKDFFINNNIKYKKEFSFKDLKSDKNYKLRFDFAVFKNKKLFFLLELDGEQHFKPIDFLGGEESFNNLVKNDNLKNNYCLRNKIKLIRVPYYKKDLIEKILHDLLC